LCKSLTSVTFDCDSKLSRIEKRAFFGSSLISIHLPSSDVVLCEECFWSCKSLTSVTFECDSKLSRIEKAAFGLSSLISIHLPSSVEVLCESCFSLCKSLTSVTFDFDSKFSRIETLAFYRSALISIHLPSSVEVLCESCFFLCTSLTSVTFDPGAPAGDWQICIHLHCVDATKSSKWCLFDFRFGIFGVVVEEHLIFRDLGSLQHCGFICSRCFR
jgi:hypothetical protein